MMKMGNPDWIIVRQALWAVLNIFYDRFTKNEKDVPLRMCMEMRIMGGSDILMAAQHGNKNGTCSIEVLTPQNLSTDDWLSFCQEVTNKWLSLSGSDGKPLNARPHWAKQWNIGNNLKARDKQMEEYLTEDAYKDQIPKFGQQLINIGKDAETPFTMGSV